MTELSSSWVEGMQIKANIDEHELTFDARTDKGGNNTGPSPMNVLLASLMGCTMMDVIYILRKMRQDFTAVDVVITNTERAEEHPKVYTKIHLVFKIKGNNLKENKVKEAVNLSQSKYCSVSGMLSSTASLTYDVEIENTTV
ncbi:MAG: OsmC family protein [Candidatus Heimdallarchaeota archaeon]|nr:OsmC family protein [Candidatus Heimdallarchaeota archaeon]